MKNKKITFYELMGLIKDNDPPKQICYEECLWEYDESDNDYYSISKNVLLFKEYIKDSYIEDLNNTVEILPEENEMEKKNLVDLGIKDNEPIGFKFDTSINRPVLARRCDNYYYAYPTLEGWVYYRSRYLGNKDKEIIDITFDEWAYKVVETLEQEFNQKNKNDEWKDIEEIKHNGKQIYNTKTNAYNTLNSKEKNIFIPIVNQLIKNQKCLKEKLDKYDRKD